MTRPAPVFRHGVYLLTRRVVWRLFLLLPDPLAVQIFEYVIGITLRSFKREEQLEVHAAVLMSNHLHSVVYDPAAERTSFLNRLYSQLARAINKLRERRGRLFDLPSPRNKSQIMDRDALVRSIVYTICNPVRAGLVDWPHEWPGSLGDWRQILTVPIVAQKPEQFFNQSGGHPAEVVYYLTMPVCFRRENMSSKDYEAMIRDAVQAECERIHAERGGVPVLGVKAALSLPVDHRPRTPEPEPEEDTSRYRWSGDPEAAQHFLNLWIEWIALYMEMRDLWTAGKRGPRVVFPPGTDVYRRQEDAPTPDLDPDSPFAWLFPP